MPTLLAKMHLETRKKGFLKNWEISGQPTAITDGIVYGWRLRKKATVFRCGAWVRYMVSSSPGKLHDYNCLRRLPVG